MIKSIVKSVSKTVGKVINIPVEPEDTQKVKFHTGTGASGKVKVVRRKYILVKRKRGPSDEGPLSYSTGTTGSVGL